MSFLPSRQAVDLLERAGALDLRSLPRTITLGRLEFIAAIMAADLLGEEPQVEVEDVPSLVLSSLFQGRAWNAARKMMVMYPELAPAMLREALPVVLEMAEKGLEGLDWGELPPEERHRAEETLERLLVAGPGEEGYGSPELKKRLLLVLHMLVRALDREIAPLIEKLRHDAEVLIGLEELLPGQGWDMHRVALHRTFLGNLERYALILRKHKDLERMKEMLGRMDGEQRERPTFNISHSSSETHSLRFSGDLQRMLPQELVNLGDERLKLLFYARMCERRLLTYQLRGRECRDGERRRGGPVVALVDCSGSMGGGPELAAKTLLLALAHRLLEDHRPLRAILFSVEVQSYDLNGPEGTSQFLDLLCHSFDGGTDFDVALHQGIKSLEEPQWKGADILFITDGLARIKDRGCLHDWSLLKERQGSHIFTVIIGGTETGELQRISDQVFLLSQQGEWSGDSLLREITPQPCSAGSCWVTQ